MFTYIYMKGHTHNIKYYLLRFYHVLVSTHVFIKQYFIIDIDTNNIPLWGMKLSDET